MKNLKLKIALLLTNSITYGIIAIICFVTIILGWKLITSEDSIINLIISILAIIVIVSGIKWYMKKYHPNGYNGFEEPINNYKKPTDKENSYKIKIDF